MSTNERTGTRDLAYSGFHRAPNLAKHLDQVFAHIANHRDRRMAAYRAAYDCTMIDVDGLEYCRYCRSPLALIEVKHRKAADKTTAVLAALARRADVPAFLVEYEQEEGQMSFHVTACEPAGARRPLNADEYAAFVLGLHQCGCRS